jgi:hypothetical protein
MLGTIASLRGDAIDRAVHLRDGDAGHGHARARDVGRELGEHGVGRAAQQRVLLAEPGRALLALEPAVVGLGLGVEVDRQVHPVLHRGTFPGHRSIVSSERKWVLGHGALSGSACPVKLMRQSWRSSCHCGRASQ